MDKPEDKEESFHLTYDPSGALVPFWFAVAALACGVGSWLHGVVTLFLFGPPAIALGVIAFVKLWRSPFQGEEGRPTATWVFALAGILLPCANGAYGYWVVRPAIVEIRKQVVQLMCKSNLAGLGIQLRIYAGENRSRLPLDLREPFQPEGVEHLKCPGAESFNYQYVPGVHMRPMEGIVPLVYEPIENHGTGWNILWGDLTVTFEPANGKMFTKCREFSDLIYSRELNRHQLREAYRHILDQPGVPQDFKAKVLACIAKSLPEE